MTNFGSRNSGISNSFYFPSWQKLNSLCQSLFSVSKCKFTSTRSMSYIMSQAIVLKNMGWNGSRSCSFVLIHFKTVPFYPGWQQICNHTNDDENLTKLKCTYLLLFILGVPHQWMQIHKTWNERDNSRDLLFSSYLPFTYSFVGGIYGVNFHILGDF